MLFQISREDQALPVVYLGDDEDDDDDDDESGKWNGLGPKNLSDYG
jgi:hypothetical protein